MERTTIEEKFVLQGRFTADKFRFVDFSLGYGDQVKFVVSADDEVKKGDLLGLINAKPFYSTTNGLIQEISVGSESGYFKVLDLDSLCLLYTSSFAKTLKKAVEEAKKIPEVREDRVEILKRKIQDGTYEPDLDALARILRKAGFKG